MPPSTSTSADANSAATATVEAFLAALQRFDIDEAATFLTEDAQWINVGLPTVHGKRAIVSALRRIGELPGAAFTVELHNIVAEGDVVMTERTDGLYAGPVGGEFWVCGTFELRDGRIVVWRDRFDYVDMLRGTLVGTLRGLLGRR